MYWRLQLAGWFVYGAATAAAAVWIIHLPLLQVAGQAVALTAIGVAISDLLHRGILWRHLATAPLLTRAPQTFVLSVVLGALGGTVTTLTGLATWQVEDLAIRGFPQTLVVWAVHTLNWTLLLLAWSVVYFSLHAFRQRAEERLRTSELERQLQAAELRLLKAQLNPHFLFNALNTVRALIAENPARAQDAVTQLARTLRYTLSSGQDDLVTLERELAIVDDYLAIEALRLGDRLTTERVIAPETRGVQIPVMLLQMLVENAIKHGIAELPNGGVLAIASGIHDGTLILTVQNTRPRASYHGLGPESIGLRNSAERLRLLFGPGASVNLDLSQLDQAVARVRIPCKR